MPKPTTPFGAQLCVYKSGQTSCPTGYSVKKQLEYQTWNEGRTCDCTCGAVGCGGNLTLYTDDTCGASGGTSQVIPYNGTCVSVGADPTPGSGVDTRSLKWIGAGPVCGAINGTPGGAPSPNDPVTICCQGP
jgi:hypothetical protein